MINLPVAVTIYMTFEEIWVKTFPEKESLIWKVVILFLMYLVIAANYCMIYTAMKEPGIMPKRRWPNEVAKRYDSPTDKDYYTWCI